MELIKWVLIVAGLFLLYCLFFSKKKGCGCHGGKGVGKKMTSTSTMNITPPSGGDSTSSATARMPQGQCVTGVRCG